MPFNHTAPFNPYARYNVADPYGTSPSQRLAGALAGTTYQRRGTQAGATQQKFDTTQSYKKSIPRLSTGFAKRGLQDSGLRERAMSDLAAQFVRQRATEEDALTQALFQLSLQDLGSFGTYMGGRFEDALGGFTSRAQMAAKIREAMT